VKALAHRDYRIFWIGSIVAGIGQWMQIFAIGWMIAELAVREGDPRMASFDLGLLGLANAVPSLLLTPLAGALADRHDQRFILQISQIGSAVVGIAFAALALTGTATVPSLILLYGVLSALKAFDFPIRWSMVGRIVPPRDQLNAIGLQSVSFNVPQILGPAAGGALIGSLGAGGLLVIAALSGVAVIGALAAMRPIPPIPSARANSVMRDMGDGLMFVLRHPVIRAAAVICVAVAFFARPSTQLLPAFTVAVLGAGATELSWLLSATGIGGVVGALVVANLGGVRRRGFSFFAAAAFAGVAVILLGIQSTLVPALVVSFAFGAAAMLFGGLSNTVFQMLAPDALRGRVMALYTMIFMGLIPLGTMAMGSLGALIGVDRAFVIGGALVLATTAYGVVRHAGVRELSAPTIDAAAEIVGG
jgi:predicted MFS family arabinose efflux permease